MGEIIRTEPLSEGGEIRYYDDGREITVGDDGRITHTKLPPDFARKMSRSGSLKAKAAAAEDVGAILQELGLPDNTTNRTLGELFLSGGSGAVAAVRELKRQVDASYRDVKQAHTVEVWPVLDVARVDGVLYRKMSGDELLEVAELLREAKQRKAKDAKVVAESAE